MELKGKKVLVFGAGISGIGSCGLLEKEGAQVILYDGKADLDIEKVKGQMGNDAVQLWQVHFRKNCLKHWIWSS